MDNIINMWQPTNAQETHMQDHEVLTLAASTDFRKLRGKRTQMEVAIAIGEAQSTISNLERHGPKGVSVHALRRVLDFYAKESTSCPAPSA